MGTWGPGIFDNDTAADWAFGLEDLPDTQYIEKTLERVIATRDAYLEAPDAEEALAAAEGVARLRGRWGVRSTYSEPLDEWVEAVKLQPAASLVAMAIRAIDRVLAEPSELVELWQEADEYDAWKEGVLGLRARLAE